MSKLHMAIMNRMAERNDEGATAVEYGLMVALIAAFCIVAVTALGVNIAAQFTAVAAAIAGA